MTNILYLTYYKVFKKNSLTLFELNTHKLHR